MYKIYRTIVGYLSGLFIKTGKPLPEKEDYGEATVQFCPAVTSPKNDSEDAHTVPVKKSLENMFKD